MFRRSFLWRTIRLCHALLTLIVLLSATFTVRAQNEICIPGTVCLFPLDKGLSKCRFNEELFFTRTDRWEIPAGEYDFFNYRFGPFTNSNGYVSPGGWQGGCVCDVATWINYFLKVNGITTVVDAPYHKRYVIPGVPNTGSEFNKDFIVTVQHPEGPKPVTLERWGYDLKVENNSDLPVIIRWQIVDNAENKTDYVSIWLEDVVPVIPLETEVVYQEEVQVDADVAPLPTATTTQVVLDVSDVVRIGMHGFAESGGQPINQLWLPIFLILAAYVCLRFVRPA